MDQELLFLPGGTGDIAFRISKQCPGAEVTVGDISENMLKFGRKRAKKEIKNDENSKQITWTVADGQNLPFEDTQFDLYTVSFGIRNYGDLNKGVQEAYRVLKPGGRFMCLEFSDVENQLLKSVYDRYSMDFIPVFGAVVAGDWDSYKYLVESIRKFPNKAEFRDMISNVGFKGATYNSFLSGVAAIHSGFKL